MKPNILVFATRIEYLRKQRACKCFSDTPATHTYHACQRQQIQIDDPTMYTQSEAVNVQSQDRIAAYVQQHEEMNSTPVLCVIIQAGLVIQFIAQLIHSSGIHGCQLIPIYKKEKCECTLCFTCTTCQKLKTILIVISSPHGLAHCDVIQETN